MQAFTDSTLQNSFFDCVNLNINITMSSLDVHSPGFEVRLSESLMSRPETGRKAATRGKLSSNILSSCHCLTLLWWLQFPIFQCSDRAGHKAMTIFLWTSACFANA